MKLNVRDPDSRGWGIAKNAIGIRVPSLQNVVNMSDIAETAIMFARQAEKYADCAAFNLAETFEILHDTIGLFSGTHFQSATMRRYLVEAVNAALSSIPGNEVSVRCVEIDGKTFVLEWLPYINRHLVKAGQPS